KVKLGAGSPTLKKLPACAIPKPHRRTLINMNPTFIRGVIASPPYNVSMGEECLLKTPQKRDKT
ncbi:MAG: hypothetical protein QNK38_02850, partial [Nitrospirota bacterium]|nr:hypothetical protein [Nitrospirota bacterium]MDX2419997.1 hypothetical protein [Nitrospirota bacterium]